MDVIINCISLIKNSLNKNKNSLQYFEKTLELSYQLNDKRKAAETHLNISYVLSQIGKHKLAIEQCLACIILMQEIVTSNKNIQTLR